MGEIKRNIYSLVERKMQPQKIMVVYGARRVGKTNLVKQLYENFSGKKIFLNGESYDTERFLSERSISNYKRLFAGTDFKVLATFDEEIYFPDSMYKAFGSPAIWTNKYGEGEVYAVSPHIERTLGKEYLMGIFITKILSK